MKIRTVAFLSLLLVTANLIAATNAKPRPTIPGHRVLEIGSGWQFREMTGLEPTKVPDWHSATVPGTVHTDLLAARLIGEPFYRDNEAGLQWIELRDWEYKTQFAADDAMLSARNLELVFDGLDTYATVFLNEREILRADSMFRTWRVDVKHELKPGPNELRIVFHSPINTVMPAIKDLPYHLPSSPQNIIGKSEVIGTDPFTRKADYHYGWDWGPRFVTSGIWRPIHLDAWDGAVIRDLHIRQQEVTANLARVNAEVLIEADQAGSAVVAVSYARKTGTQTRKTALTRTSERRSVILVPGVNHITLPISITKPARWYPNEYGEQAMYTFEATVSTGARINDRRAVSTGLRSLELRREPDQWGRSFEFVVNGI